jgi:hypothetical protein
MSMTRNEIVLLEAISGEGEHTRAYAADMALRITLTLAANRLGIGLPAYALDGDEGFIRFAQKVNLAVSQIPRRLRAKRFNAALGRETGE